jgi:hypothetical protein
MHSFLKSEPLKSIVARHHPLGPSQVFAITRSEILHQVGSQPGEEVQTSPDGGGLILDPPLVRQVGLRHTHLLSLGVPKAFFAIQSVQSLIRVLREGMRQLANFDPAHLIDDCELIFEFVPSQAVMTPQQSHAKRRAAELEEVQVRIRAGQRCIEELKKASEELRQQLAEDRLDRDDFSRGLETEKADLKARSSAAENEPKCQIRSLKETGRERRFRANMQTGKLKQDLSQLRAEYFTSLAVEDWLKRTDELACEVMRLIDDGNQPRYSEKLDDVGFVLWTYSATDYQLLRKVIPLPSLHALHSRFKDTVKERHAQLSAVAHLQSVLGDFLELGKPCRPAVVIGVDAVSVWNTFIGVNIVAQQRESFIFLLNLQPISAHLPGRPIHVLNSETGNANEPI